MNDSPDSSVRDNHKSSNSRELIYRWIGLSISIGLFVILYLSLQPQTNPFINKEMVIGQVVVIIVLALAVAYLFAYKFFNSDITFLYIAIGWIANAAYLLFEFFFNNHCHNEQSDFCKGHPKTGYLEVYCKDDPTFCINYAIGVFLFSFISTCFFYYAAQNNDDRQVTRGGSVVSKNLFASTKISLPIWLLILLILTAVPFWLTGGLDPALRFVISSTAGMIFTAFSLFYLGYTFERSLKKERTYLIIRIFPYTFYVYGLLQFTYPFKLYLHEINPNWLLGLFVTASMLKLLNIFGLMFLIFRIKLPEYVRAENDLELANLKLSGRNHLATLGAISASIEHDLKTPLGVLRTEILALKKAISNNPRLNTYIDRIEAQRLRISAIAKVVPFIRSSNEFYDTDKFMSRVSITEIINLAIRSVKKELSLNTEKYFFTNRNKDYFVRAFPEMIEQIFTNLFKNSLEAVDEKGRDGGAIEVNIRTERVLPKDVQGRNPNVKNYSKWIRIDVSDKGCGIEADKIPLLTTLYTSKGENKPNGGIGLFIASIILEFHDALIDFESTVGLGTTVSIFFPEWEAYLELRDFERRKQSDTSQTSRPSVSGNPAKEDKT